MPASLPSLRRSARSQGQGNSVSLAAGVLVVMLSLAACSGCSSWKRLASLQKLSDTPDPETGGALTLLDPDSPAARALESAPGVISQHMQQGEDALRREDLDQARTHFEAVLAEQPQHARAHHRLGIIADLQGRFPQAESHYRVALDQSGEDATLLCDLGWSYALQKRYAEAESALKRARAADPTHQQAVGNLGTLYAMQGDRERCLAMFRLVASDEEARATVAKLFEGRGGPAPEAPANLTPPATLADRANESLDLIDRGLDDLAAAAPTNEPSGGRSAMAAEIARLRGELKQATDRTAAAGEPVASAAERLRNPRTLADIGHPAATAAPGQPAEGGNPFAAFHDGDEPRPGGLPQVVPGDLETAMAALGEAASSATQPQPLADRDAAPLGAASPASGPRDANAEARRQALLLGLSGGTGGGWTLLAAAGAMPDSGPASNTAASVSAPTTPSASPAELPPGVPMPVAQPAAAVPVAERSVPTPSTGGAIEPPRYDPGNSRAGFGTGNSSAPLQARIGVAGGQTVQPTGGTQPKFGVVQPIPTTGGGETATGSLPQVQPGRPYAPPPVIRPGAPAAR